MAWCPSRGDHFAALIAPHVEPASSVLDLGCGTLQIASALAARVPGVRVLGIDVLTPPAIPSPAVTFQPFDGRTIPLPDRSVDVTCIAFVLHHADEPDDLLREALRVTRRRLVVLEDVYENRLEKLLLKACDLGNLLQAPRMHLPFRFRTEAEWMKTFRACAVSHVETTRIRPAIPKPTRHRQFVVTL